jgi:hypothetical protein
LNRIGIACSHGWSFALAVAFAAAGGTRPVAAAGKPTPVKTVSLTATKSVPLDTISDFNTFYKEFRAAIAKRDRAALKSCMVKNFLFTLEEFEEADPRDAAFKEWDRPEVKGWEAMDRILTKGSRQDPMVPSLMVAPPEWVTDPHYVDYRVGFERRDGVWRWVWSMKGD